MNRIFGTGKKKEAVEAPPPPDIGSSVTKIDGRVAELDKKVS
jgi:hypothetical protein